MTSTQPHNVCIVRRESRRLLKDQGIGHIIEQWMLLETEKSKSDSDFLKEQLGSRHDSLLHRTRKRFDLFIWLAMTVSIPCQG